MFLVSIVCSLDIAIHEGLYFQIVVASDLHVHVSDKDGRIVKGCWHTRFSHRRYSFITFTVVAERKRSKIGCVHTFAVLTSFENQCCIEDLEKWQKRKIRVLTLVQWL